MKKSESSPESSSAQWEPKFPFDLVIAYEDNPTRDRAMLLYDRIAQQLLDDYDFQCAWWKLDHLRARYRDHFSPYINEYIRQFEAGIQVKDERV